MKKVLVLDDHEIFRKGLKQVLAESPDTIMTVEARTRDEALNEIMKKDFDLVLLDISSPGDGINTLREIRSLKPSLPILVLGIYPDEQYVTLAFKVGASGYLNRACAPGELLRAIKKILHGTGYINSSLAQRLVFGLSKDIQMDPNRSLSDREHQVTHLLAQGKTNKEIASQLSLSAKTISTYRSRVLEKMNLKNNSELIRYALAHDLVS